MVALTTNEVVALFDLDERRVRKEVEHGIVGTASPPTFGLVAVVYLRTLGKVGITISALEDRRKLYRKIHVAVRTKSRTVALSPILELKLEEVIREVTQRLERFLSWKRKLVEDDRILGGEPVFPKSRLAVRQVGGMLLRGAAADEVREDYPYLSDEDIEFAGLYARAYPRLGRPGGRQAPAR